MIKTDSKNSYNFLTNCNEEITEAMTLFKNGDSEGAIAKIKKALNVEKIHKDVPSQIVIYLMLGTCQRLAKDHDAAWDAFVQGWNLIETLDKETISSNTCFLFYAYEMSRVESNAKEKRVYYERFSSIWGPNWVADVFSLTNV